MNDENYQKIQKVLSSAEVSPAFRNVWVNFSSSQAEAASKWEFDIYPSNVPSLSHAMVWQLRGRMWSKKGIEMDGFFESVEQLKKFEGEIGVFAVRTKTHRAVGFLEGESGKFLGLLYFEDNMNWFGRSAPTAAPRP